MTHSFGFGAARRRRRGTATPTPTPTPTVSRTVDRITSTTDATTRSVDRA
jgi:hypothetical protein